MTKHRIEISFPEDDIMELRYLPTKYRVRHRRAEVYMPEEIQECIADELEMVEGMSMTSIKKLNDERILENKYRDL